MHNYTFAQKDVALSSERSFYESYTYSDLSLNLHHVTKPSSRSFVFILLLGRNYDFHYLEEETKVQRGELT